MNKRIGTAVLSLAILLAAVAPVSAQSWSRFGGSMTGRKKATYIGGGAAAGAVIGGLLNGRKGAVVGALLGAGAGAATVYIKGKREENRYRYDSRYYNDRYYNDRYYDNGNYNNGYYNSGYYNNGYNYRGSNYRNGGRCNRY